MTPEVRDLWEQCAKAEDRSLTNLFEVLVRAHAKKLKLSSVPVARAPEINPKTQEK
jgi:hypothetical protein